jgi:hypothetical protein
MASWTSGNLDTNNQYVKYTITITENSTSVENNTSNVTVKVKFFRTNSGYETYGTGKVYCTIDGTKYTSSVGLSQKITNSGIVLFTKTLNIKHKTDGSKTLSVSSYISIDLNGSTLSSSSQSYSHALTKIARNSTISSVTSSVEVDGTNKCTVEISRAVSTHTHTVTWKIGSYTHSATSVGTSTSYAIPTSWMNAIPSATSGTATVTVTTYSGSTKIGSTVSKNFTLKIPSSIVPSVSATIAMVNGTVPSSWGIYVQGKSKCTITPSSSGSYSSTIKTITITGGTNGKYNKSMTTDTAWTTPTLAESGTISFTIKATDSRNRSASVTKSITVYEYKTPSISSVTAQRCTSDGTLNDDGTYLKVSVPTSSYSSCNGKNTCTLTVMYKESTATTWSTATNVSTTASVIGAGGISTSKSYNVRFTITDAFTSVTKDVTVSTSGCLLNFRKDKDGLSLGKFAETSGFDVKWSSVFRSDVTVNGALNVPGNNIQFSSGYGMSLSGSTLTIVAQGSSLSLAPPNGSGYAEMTSAGNSIKLSQSGALTFSATHASTLTLTNYTVSGLKIAGLTSTAGLVLNNTKYVRGYIANGSKIIDLLGLNGSDVCNVGYSDNQTVLRGTSINYNSTTGTTIASDKNLKKDFITLDDKYDSFFDNLNPLAYRYKLGTSNRMHCGFIAQEVEEALSNAGLTNQDFGGIAIDRITSNDRETVEDENGNVVDDNNSSINYLLDHGFDKKYGLIYEEFIALTINQSQKLKKRVNDLEKEIQELKNILNNKE